MATIITDRTLTGDALGPNVKLKSYRKDGKVYFKAVRTFLDQKPHGIRKARRRRGKVAGIPDGGDPNRAHNELERLPLASPKDQQSALAVPSAIVPSSIASENAIASALTQHATTAPESHGTMDPAELDRLMTGSEHADREASRQLHHELLRAAKTDSPEAPARADSSTMTLPSRPKAAADLEDHTEIYEHT